MCRNREIFFDVLYIIKGSRLCFWLGEKYFFWIFLLVEYIGLLFEFCYNRIVSVVEFWRLFGDNNFGRKKFLK